MQYANLAFSKTRLAPTPSGYLHLGNVLSFVITVALAQKAGAKVLLRIDDYDKERITERYVQDVFDTLHFLEIPWHEGPNSTGEFYGQYAQRHRLHLYREALQRLIEDNKVFACTCSRTDILRINNEGIYPGTCRYKGLPLHTTGSALRLLTPESAQIKIQTIKGEEIATAIPASVKDFVVRKKDGAPSYQLCSMIDDLYFGTDLIVRGADLWPSTLAQLYLGEVLAEKAFQQATFVHHPLLLEAGTKMSKSEGATSVYQLRKEGKTPGDIYGLIAQMLGLQAEAYNLQSLVAALSVSNAFVF